MGEEPTKMIREMLDALHEEGDIRMKDKERREALDVLALDINAACIDQPEFRRLVRLYKKRSIHLQQIAGLYSSSKGKVPALNLSKANVTLNVIQGICPYVMFLNSNLVSLNLSGNPIGIKGAKALGDALTYNNSIEHLELESCRLVGSAFRPEFDGVLALSKGIASSRSKLRFINVAKNGLSPNGVRIISGAVSFHRSVTALDISSNSAGSNGELEGTLALVTLLTCQKRLTWLSIANSCFNHKGAYLLKDALSQNFTLTHLDLSNCGLERVKNGIKDIMLQTSGTIINIKY